MTTVAEQAAERWRLRKFAENLVWARWGRFSVSDLGYPCICGVCGEWYETQMAKADHLRSEHGAEVWVVAGPGGEALYEWTRR